MMDDIRDLYQEIILDHNKKPRNFYRMEHPDCSLEGYNPLCGDHYTFFVKFDGDVISDISFEGSGCAISKASASLMSAFVKGKTKDEFERMFQLFHDIVTGKTDAAEHLEELDKLAAFGGVSEYPMRVKCATLPWHTLHGAMTGKTDAVTSE